MLKSLCALINLHPTPPLPAPLRASRRPASAPSRYPVYLLYRRDLYALFNYILLEKIIYKPCL
jgi:hypothetical protein